MAPGNTLPESTVPSDRKQLNIRMDAETEERVNRLLAAVSAAIGLKVSQSDLFRLGMIELEKKYLPNEPEKKRKGK
jgi:hypothetical protein